MGINRLNHAVVYVRDVDRSVAFYRDVLGFSVQMERPGQAAFMQAPDSTNDHDIGLFAIGEAADNPAGHGTVGLYHLGWEIGTLDELQELAGRLTTAGAYVGATDHGTTKSIYARDPDGLEFEVAWLVPADLLDDGAFEQRTRRGQPLDLEKEKARYGAGTRGGVGVSSPAALSP
jgi:catechol 2,3-dioxygenase-like lactoylglutathione lyase family enzyme